MSPLYYHNAHAKCGFKEIESEFYRCNHRKDTHKRKYGTKNDELVFKDQNLTGSYTTVKLALENIWG